MVSTWIIKIRLWILIAGRWWLSWTCPVGSTSHTETLSSISPHVNTKSSASVEPYFQLGLKWSVRAVRRLDLLYSFQSLWICQLQQFKLPGAYTRRQLLLSFTSGYLTNTPSCWWTFFTFPLAPDGDDTLPLVLSFNCLFKYFSNDELWFLTNESKYCIGRFLWNTQSKKLTSKRWCKEMRGEKGFVFLSTESRCFSDEWKAQMLYVKLTAVAHEHLVILYLRI